VGDKDLLAEHFEASRVHLRAVAYRMLGSVHEADDAVQEAWLRLARADTSEVKDLRAWLTTVTARVCLDMLRARKMRGEESLVRAEAIAGGNDIARDVEVADAIGVAMLVVLEALSPAERVAFVLHDLFNLPFDDIAPIVSRSPAAARQLASRARRRVQGAPASADSDRKRQREIVQAFLAASREGDFSALITLLDPEVVLRADASAVAASLARLGDSPPLAPEIDGQDAVAAIFTGRAKAAQPVLVDGEAGLAIIYGGKPRMVFNFVIDRDRIVEIALIADPASVKQLDLEI
jgi:RNA polymerase sigma factor (sigma-70 family)